jgi:uncharacterized membrane protein YtjA (UPF0391 family)
MIKLALIWFGIGLIAAFFGFTGILGDTTLIAQDLSYVCAGFVLLSLLFCLFEPPAEKSKGLMIHLQESSKTRH